MISFPFAPQAQRRFFDRSKCCYEAAIIAIEEYLTDNCEFCSTELRHRSWVQLSKCPIEASHSLATANMRRRLERAVLHRERAIVDHFLFRRRGNRAESQEDHA